MGLLVLMAAGLVLFGQTITALAAVALLLQGRARTRRRALILALGAAMVAVSVVGTLVSGVSALTGLVSEDDPGTRAGVIAHGLSGALNGTAFGCLLAVPLAVIVVLTRKNGHWPLGSKVG